jgi:hypothetical protein
MAESKEQESRETSIENVIGSHAQQGENDKESMSHEPESHNQSKHKKGPEQQHKPYQDPITEEYKKEWNNRFGAVVWSRKDFVQTMKDGK